MKKPSQQPTTTISADLIAPCGMNCRLCWGYIREKNTCPGCRMITSPESPKSKHRTTCKIRNCDYIQQEENTYCSDRCPRFPCPRLKQLDQRYRTRYGMSMIDNLKMIRESGIDPFIKHEEQRWICPQCGELMCIHRPGCLTCGYERILHKTDVNTP